jgi:hypothetical protein
MLRVVEEFTKDLAGKEARKDKSSLPNSDEVVYEPARQPPPCQAYLQVCRSELMMIIY